MSTQHTPGPWFTEATSTIGHHFVIDSDGFTICDPSPMGEANARLIAAAPDLLAALIDAEFLLRKAAQLAGPMQDSFARSAADARAAIARAAK
jgi:hypothetical protein